MSFWDSTIKIGSLEVPRFMSGPLDGITDSPFRRLVRIYSPDALVYSEMRHVAAVVNDPDNKPLKFDNTERPLAFQISANNTDFIEEAVEKILARGVEVLDLNIGCPARAVVRNGAGSALMGDLERLEKILRLFRAKLPIPFTVKIRAGFKEKNAVEVAKLAQDCGVDALAIHPRLQTQPFTGQPDYALTAAVKEALDIPVLFSGGVINYKLAQMVYDQTGVDGFLIGRGMWAKPWKLKEMHAHARGEEFSIPLPEVLSVARQHFELMVDHYNGQQGLYCFRKHLPFYIRGLPQASSVRQELVRVQSIDQMRERLTMFAGSVSV